MIRNLLFLLGSFCFTFFAFGQSKEKYVLKIGNQGFSLREFEYIFNKNNPVSQNPMTKGEYLDLFVNYKLKVRAAQEAGLDTMASFVSELQYYRNELSKPYLSDKKAENQIIEEAYERMKYELDASHILFMVKAEATPADTMAAWNKAQRAYGEIMKGADFNQVALRYSEDPSVQRNAGKLGYFSAFQMVYAFETGAYNTPVGQVSPIVRSPYGYHLIKVHDKRSASGEIQVAHIMKMVPQNGSEQQVDRARMVIDSLHTKILAGEDFSALASDHSDDRQSALHGGELPWFSRGRMVASFANEAFSLKENGDVSMPFRTPFGWHLVKRLDYRPLGTLEQERDNILQRLGNDERSLAGVKSLVAALKKDYHFKVDSALLQRLLVVVDEKNDSSLQAKASELSGDLFSMAGVKTSVGELVDVLKGEHLLRAGVGRQMLLDGISRFEDRIVLDYEKSILEKKYPDFAFLMQEYHDGLLVFEISQRMVWEKASSDTTALKAFYHNNIHRYSKPGSFKGDVVVCSNAIAAQKLDRRIKKGKVMTSRQIQKLAGEGVQLYSGLFIHGADAAMDGMLWPAAPEANKLVVLNGVFEYGEALPFDSIRGTVVSDYQNDLEQTWLKQLHGQYRPMVFRKVVE